VEISSLLSHSKVLNCWHNMVFLSLLLNKAQIIYWSKNENLWCCFYTTTIILHHILLQSVSTCIVISLKMNEIFYFKEQHCYDYNWTWIYIRGIIKQYSILDSKRRSQLWTVPLLPFYVIHIGRKVINRKVFRIKPSRANNIFLHV